jgi:hypothetical protein
LSKYAEQPDPPSRQALSDHARGSVLDLDSTVPPTAITLGTLAGKLAG